MIKNNRGVALSTLVIAVLVMLTITGTIAYKSTDTIKLRKLDDMYNDIRLLNKKVTNYYMENNNLPVLNDNNGNEIIIKEDLIENVVKKNEEKVNPNDNENYYIIDLKKIGGITLKYGKEYEEYVENNEKKDLYIINAKSHTIYYLKGIEIKLNEETLVKYKLDEKYSEVAIVTPNISPSPNVPTDTWPEEYQKVEYIESTGTQYLELNYTPERGDEFKFSGIPNASGVTRNNQSIISAGTGDYQLILLVSNIWTVNTPVYYKCFANGVATEIPSSYFQDSWRSYYINDKGKLAIDGIYVGQTTPAGDVNTNLYLFRRANGSSYSNSIMGEFEIINNEVHKIHLVPCYRKSDNEIGMYDTVNKVFYTNQGTGIFLKGNNGFRNVGDSEYQEVEYIESTGTQYIDTGIKPNKNTFKFEYDIAFTKTDTRQLTGVNPVWYFGVNNEGNYEVTTLNTGVTVNADEFKNITQEVTYNASLVSNKLTIDNITYERNVSNENIDGNYYLFALSSLNQVKFYCSARIKSFKMYENDVLICDMIPCYRKTDNVICMYDKVSKMFYTNQGTGTFLKGNDVN